MTISISTQAPFLRTSRKFPQDLNILEKELTNMYLDIAFAVNARIIGNYTNVASLTGSIWNTSSTAMGTGTFKISTYRQVYNFGTVAPNATLRIAHGITTLAQFTSITGTCITNFPDYRPIPFADPSVATGNIALLCNNSQVIVINGSTAPTINSGIIVLEWLVQS